MKKRELEPGEKPLAIVSSIPWVRLFLTAWLLAVPAVVAALWLVVSPHEHSLGFSKIASTGPFPRW